jgi:hypothetical protein
MMQAHLGVNHIGKGHAAVDHNGGGGVVTRGVDAEYFHRVEWSGWFRRLVLTGRGFPGCQMVLFL